MKLPAGNEDSMLFEVQELFKSISSQKKPKGILNHKKFIAAVKKANQLFDNDEHHDSHEFVTWILDNMHEGLQKLEQPSFVMELFGGKLQSTFTCLNCEAHNIRSEQFNNLSLDIEKNTSLNYCIQRFSCKELLNKSNKLHCEKCLTKQVATKEIQIQSCPKILLTHLKRFKFDEQTYQHQKLCYRIPYPTELKVDSLEGARVYNIKGIVVHVGSGMAFGHYYALVKSQGKWIKFNDTSVSVVEDNDIQIYFGAPPLQERGQAN